MVPWLHQWCNKRRNRDVRHTRLRSETQSCVNLFALKVLMMTWYARSEHLWKLLTSDQVLVAWPKAIRTKAGFKANGSASKKLFHLPSVVEREVRQLYRYIGEQNAVKTSIDHNHPIMCSILFHISPFWIKRLCSFPPTHFLGVNGGQPLPRVWGLQVRAAVDHDLPQRRASAAGALRGHRGHGAGLLGRAWAAERGHGGGKNPWVFHICRVLCVFCWQLYKRVGVDG